LSQRRRFAWWVLTFGGSGASPHAPGTVGSLAAVAVIGVLWASGFREWWIPLLLAFLIGWAHLAVGDQITQIFGKADPGAVVSDEVCGQWVALSVPLVSGVGWGWALLIAFGLFRLFDITKICGVGRLEKIPGKWGVLLDDLLAGVYAGVVLWALDALGGLELLP